MALDGLVEKVVHVAGKPWNYIHIYILLYIVVVPHLHSSSRQESDL